MASLDPATATSFRCDLVAAQSTVREGVCAGSDRATATHWSVWRTFCHELAIDPLLANISDPVSILQVFAVRYRSGQIAPHNKQVRGRTVEGALRSIGQTLASLGAQDPRLTCTGGIDFRIQRMIAAYKKQDPPPARVKPIPLAALRHIVSIAAASQSPRLLASAQMITLAFFFLLRPGEYTSTPSDTTPFTLADIQIFLGNVRLNITTSPNETLLQATFCTLEFTTQKNGVRGEVIGLGRSGSLLLCPVRALAHRVIHLRCHNAPPGSPLGKYFVHGAWHDLKPKDITTDLRHAVSILGSSIGLVPSDVSARSLRATGAMALLCADIDHDRIKLVGRWRSDEMIRYLHVQAAPVMSKFSKAMITSGDFRLIPNRHVTDPLVPLH